MSPIATKIVLLSALSFLLAACTASAGEVSPAESRSPAAVVTATPAPSLAPFDHGDIPAELVGRWQFEAFDHYLQDRWVDLAADGTFVYLNGPLVYGNGQPIVTGQYGVFGDEIRFGAEVAAQGSPCPRDVVGSYSWTLEGDLLTMVVIDDLCTLGRVTDWESGWTKVE